MDASQSVGEWFTILGPPMARQLSLLSERAAATRACSYCPKLCRPACPVATASGNDAVSAWGIMGGLHSLTDGSDSPTAEHLAPAFACTGCEHCQSHCELAVPVVETVLDARAVAHSQHLSPAAVREFVANLPTREERLRASATQLAASVDAPSGVVVFAGCTLVATRPSHVAAALRAIEQLVGPASLVADLCCGAPWLDAGDFDGFRARAESLSDRLRRASTVIALDAGCAHTMSVRAAERSVRARAMETLEQFVAARIDRVPAGSLASMGAFAVHDSCRAGRGMGAYDAPRSLVERLTGRRAIELAYNRERSQCSGGGGLLPITAPSVADAITRDLAELVRDSGADHVLAGCPTSSARLRAAGISSFTLSELFCELGRDRA